MRQYEAYLTNNGNLAVVVKEVSARGDSEMVYCAFISPKGEWLRECTYQEVCNIAFNGGLPIAMSIMVEDFLSKSMPKQPPVWTSVIRHLFYRTDLQLI